MRNKSKEWYAVVKRAMQLKLGRCTFCMRWSARCMIAMWSIVVLVGLLWAEPTALLISMVVAVSFTLLTVTHSTTFATRVVKETHKDSNWSRRELVLGLCKFSAAAFVSSVGFAILPRSALAQGNSPCAFLCNALYPPGPARGKCINDGARGHGICFDGPCIPAPDTTKGFKPKTDQQTKLARVLQSSTIPSALAGALFRFAYRFRIGRTPANDLETSVFKVFAKLSPGARSLLDCTLRRFESLSIDDRMHLFGPKFANLVDDAMSVDELAPLVSNELTQRASFAAFGDANCLTNETPGQPRPVNVGGPDPLLGYQNTISRINGLRTATFRRPPGASPLTAAELTSEEVEHQCSVNAGHLNCTVQTPPCPGQELDGVCLRVPQVHPGDAVFLEGFNFFDLDARVRLRAIPPGTEVLEVDAHVCGDSTTPVTETVDGVERVIADFRVKDMISFTIPSTLAAGIYQVDVIVPNTVGNSTIFPEWVSEAPLPLINVLPVSTGIFQIESEELACVDETHGTNLGSDEVGIRIVTIPINLDLSLGRAQSQKFRFGDVDSGEKRDMARILFQGSNIGAVAMTILGHEVDNEGSYENLSAEWEDILAEALEVLLLELALAAPAFIIAAAAGLAAGAAAISAAIAFAVVIIRSIWDPPDLIIEDPAGSSLLNFGELTSTNFPLPLVRTFTSPDGIAVTVTPLEKVAGQYRERRRYHSEDEDSTYEITLRYTLL